jgi:hypothetical protein
MASSLRVSRPGICCVASVISAILSRPLFSEEPDAVSLQQWNELRRAGPSGYRALCWLADHPYRAIPLLTKQLRPATAADPEVLQRLLADLDHADFARREAATKELARLGDGAATLLQKARQAGPSPEARRRIDELLARLKGPVTDTEMLRSIRAVEVLERIASPEARDLLRVLAEGDSGGRLTREARLSLERLSGKPPP